MIPVRDTTVARGSRPVTTVPHHPAILAMFIQETPSRRTDLSSCSDQALLDITGYLIERHRASYGIHTSILGLEASSTQDMSTSSGISSFLSVFGPPVEKILGVMRFALFYIVAIFAAFYAHALVHPHSSVPVVGASGAIAAIMGAYLILNPKGRILTIIPLILLA
ncbi:MAG: rhomboid family intramembrane serine protease [Desulfobacterales bacterium]|nr:rhomboid family intramembrane serine protease [Desulfobacterales bacterium]